MQARAEKRNDRKTKRIPQPSGESCLNEITQQNRTASCRKYHSRETKDERGEREERDEREELYSSESISPTREKVTDEFSFADRERAEEIWLLSTFDDCRMPAMSAWPLQRRGRVHVEK